MDHIQVKLPEGTVEGLAQGNIQRFFSLPYAAPVTEERRFKGPMPVEVWEGVRDATRPGPRAPQNIAEDLGIDIQALMGVPVPAGADYLTLNVYAPLTVEQPRPVMVFIHGGSFVAGSKDAPVYDGSAFARDGVVCVVINYRLGIEGFLPIPGVPTNLGLRDMIAALEWVKTRISAFGGDAGNVTLFGESGGAFCTATLMASPIANRLFHRAICQSGHVYVSRDIEVMQRIVTRLAKRLGIVPDRAGFLGCSRETLLKAQDQIMRPSIWLDMRDSQGRDPSFGITRFLPVHGDDILPEPAFEALRSGAGKHIDLLIGTTLEEANLFFVPGNARDKINRFIAWWFLWRALPCAREILNIYGMNKKGSKPGQVLTLALTDLMFRWMARRTAEWHRGRSYVYEFEWRSPAFNGALGAAHAVELPFVFDTLACASGDRGLLGSGPPQALADSIHALWIKFASSGDAPWPEYRESQRVVYSLTEQSHHVEAVMPAAPFLP